MTDELDLGLEEEMALEEETAHEGTPMDPQEPPVQQPMEMAPEEPEDVAHGGPGKVAHGGPGEESEKVGLLGIAQEGLPKAAPVEPGQMRHAKISQIIHEVPSGPSNQPVGPDVPCRAPQTHKVVVAPLGPSSAEPG